MMEELFVGVGLGKIGDFGSMKGKNGILDFGLYLHIFQISSTNLSLVSKCAT